MRICIVGPGMMEIPPTGWGAVEILIWDMAKSLEKFGHEVLIVNTSNIQSIIDQVNAYNPDFVHIQYDEYYVIEPYINCNNIAITSHYGYIEQPSKYDPGYFRILNGFLSLKRAKIFALSEGIANVYIDQGFPIDKTYVIPNGVNESKFEFNPTCKFPDKSLYLGKIEPRKNQYLYHNIESLYFAGPVVDYRYNNHNYLGPFSKEYLYSNLTNYGNLVLISSGEAHALVCMEALAAGLGVVVSEHAMAHLDIFEPFIDAIPDSEIHNIECVEYVINANRNKSVTMRQDIRDYAIRKFSWDNIISKYYLPAISK